ncbi:MAG: M48 family metallopeptidase [Campylobacterales bacterium]|nr:M48 family metallopeptidase [Campylobacterales bacterium]
MKRIILRVRKKHQIELSSSQLSNKKLEDFILSQKEWIVKQHLAVKEPFLEGASFYYLCCAYTIRHHTLPLKIRGDTVYLNPSNAKHQSDRFYKKKAQEFLPSRVEFWKNTMGLEFKSLRFYCARRRWGSCNSNGVITLNPYTMKLSQEMIDYVVVHELAHLKQMNHSAAFYSIVQTYIPEYKRIQKEITALSAKMITE